MISMGVLNDFHRCMDLLPWNHGMISMGEYYYFIGFIEKFQCARGYDVTQLNTSRISNSHEFPWCNCSDLKVKSFNTTGGFVP